MKSKLQTKKTLFLQAQEQEQFYLLFIITSTLLGFFPNVVICYSKCQMSTENKCMNIGISIPSTRSTVSFCSRYFSLKQQIFNKRSVCTANWNCAVSSTASPTKAAQQKWQENCKEKVLAIHSRANAADGLCSLLVPQFSQGKELFPISCELSNIPQSI